MAEDFADGLFTPDVESIFDMMPMDLAFAQLDDEERAEAEAAREQEIAETQAALEEKYGDTAFDWRVNVIEEEELDEDELAELNEFYEEAGLTAEKAIAAEIEIILSRSGTEESMPLDLIFVLIDGNWYLDMASILSSL